MTTKLRTRLLLSICAGAWLLSFSVLTANAREEAAFWEVVPRPQRDGRPMSLSKVEARLDHRGRLWVKAWQDGLITSVYYYLDGTRWRGFEPHLQRGECGLALHRQAGKKMFFSTTCNNGRVFYELTDHGLRLLAPVPGRSGVLCEDAGRLWFATNEVIACYESPTGDSDVALKAMAPLLLDDRQEMRTEATRKLLALGSSADAQLDGLYPEIKQWPELARGLKAALRNPALVWAHGPWRKWQIDGERSKVPQLIPGPNGDVFAVAEHEIIWFAHGELKSRLKHKRPSSQRDLFPLGAGLLLVSTDTHRAENKEPQSWYILDCANAAVRREIGAQTLETAGVPASVAGDPVRFQKWLCKCVRPDPNGRTYTERRMTNEWTSEEISSGVGFRQSHHNRAMPSSVATAFPEEVLMGTHGALRYLRGGREYMFDWRNGVMPGYSTVLVDPNGVFWLVSETQVARFSPGSPTSSPVPAGGPPPQFEMIPLLRHAMVQTPDGSIYVFRKADRGEVARFADGKWSRITQGLFPDNVDWQRFRIHRFWVDDRERVFVLWSDGRRDRLTRGSGKDCVTYEREEDGWVDAYRTGSRHFYAWSESRRSDAVHERRRHVCRDGIRMGWGSRIRHFDGKEWVKTLPDEFHHQLPFTLSDGRLAIWAQRSGTGSQRWIAEYSLFTQEAETGKMQKHTVLPDTRVLLPGGGLVGWSADLTTMPRGAVVLHKQFAYRGEDFLEFGAKGWCRRVDQELKGYEGTWNPFCVNNMGLFDHRRGADGSVFLNSPYAFFRWVKGHLFTVNLRYTPAGHLNRTCLATTRNGELWCTGFRSANCGGDERYQLVRWKPGQFEAHVALDGRHVRFSATLDGRPHATQAFLWRVDNGAWRRLTRSSCLDTSRLPATCRVVEVIAISEDGRHVSPVVSIPLPTSPAEAIQDR